MNKYKIVALIFALLCWQIGSYAADPAPQKMIVYIANGFTTNSKLVLQNFFPQNAAYYCVPIPQTIGGAGSYGEFVYSGDCSGSNANKFMAQDVAPYVTYSLFKTATEDSLIQTCELSYKWDGNQCSATAQPTTNMVTCKVQASYVKIQNQPACEFTLTFVPN